MATLVPMPKLGNTVESTIIVRWVKAVGEMVKTGETLLEVETDKAIMEVESPTTGKLLAHLFQVGDEVPVLTNVAVIGDAGEHWEDPNRQAAENTEKEAEASNAIPSLSPPERDAPAPSPFGADEHLKISPRARKLAERKGVDVLQLIGTGPDGRIIERDIQAAINTQPRLTPVARNMIDRGGFALPEGASGRVSSKDLVSPAPPTPSATPAPVTTPDDDITVIPLKGTRKVIAQRMLESMQTTAQLTLHRTADARAIKALRERLKSSPPEMGVQGVTINDLVLFAAARTLPHFPDLNALFVNNETIHQHKRVHLGTAVDTPRGLIVPVVRDAHRLSLKALADEAHRLAAAAQDSKITPDELSGGTFTVTNLGGLGIEQFTPILNPPQVAILGVGGVQLKPVEGKTGVEFIPHLSLSLTINHQVVDGAPGARFLAVLAENLKQIDLLIAL